MSKEQTRTLRKTNYEALRILSILLIICFHYVWHGNLVYSSITVNKIITDVVCMLGEIGVNCFILISGYFLVEEKNFRVKKLVFLILQVNFYFVVGQLLGIIFGTVNAENCKSLYAWIFPIVLNKDWFATAYILLFIFSPYLNKLALSLSKKEFRNLLLILLVLYSIIPTLLAWKYKENNTEAFMYYNRLLWAIIVYLIGVKIRFYRFDKISTLRRSIYLFCGCFLFVVFYVIGTNLMQRHGILDHAEPRYFWEPNTVPILACSIALFLIFHYWRPRQSRIINYLAKGTFGIYLMHDGVLRSWWWESVFKCATYAESRWLALYILLAALVIFVVGTVIDQIWRGIRNMGYSIFMKMALRIKHNRG